MEATVSWTALGVESCGRGQKNKIMTMLRATAVVEVQESESHMEAERAGVKGYFRVGSYRRRVHSSLSRAVVKIKSEGGKSDNTLRQVEKSGSLIATRYGR